MAVTTHTLGHLFIWVVQGFYFLALLPQIALNHKMRSTTGLCDYWILAYMNSYIAETFYVMCLGLPTPYQIMTPLCTALILFIVCQRLVYPLPTNERVYPWLFLSMAWWLTLVPYWLINPAAVGNLAGWCFVATMSTYQIPQIIKIFRSKSVQGMSFLLVTFLGLAGLFEFIAGVILKMPMQTIVNSLRMVCVYILFCVMFKIYR
jgi:uncharacterized protein with PQ loop repeat